MSGIQLDLPVTICKDAREAAMRGFDYAAGEDYSPIRITQAVVVKNGTVSGKSTVDFILQDETGKQFVVMVTGALIDALSKVANS